SESPNPPYSFGTVRLGYPLSCKSLKFSKGKLPSCSYLCALFLKGWTTFFISESRSSFVSKSVNFLSSFSFDCVMDYFIEKPLPTKEEVFSTPLVLIFQAIYLLE